MADKVTPFPTETVDRVCRLAGALVHVLQLSDVDPPEDHLAALLLVQTAIQQAVVREKGPRELQRVLIAANERRRRYEAVWGYTPRESPGATVHALKKDEEE
jgi:hypothetical protein